MYIFARFHSMGHKICIFPIILEKLWQQRPLASYARKNYMNIIFQNKYIACKILYNSIQQNTRQNYHNNFRNNGKAAPLLSYMHQNYIIVISKCRYFVYRLEGSASYQRCSPTRFPKAAFLAKIALPTPIRFM